MTRKLKKKLQVMKFGGTSVGDASCISRAAQIVAQAAKQNAVVAVVSAMSGVTNRLVEAANSAGAVTRTRALRLRMDCVNNTTRRLLRWFPAKTGGLRLRGASTKRLRRGSGFSTARLCCAS